MPVTPYAEPTIAPNIAQPWPQLVDERIALLWSAIDALRQQPLDLQVAQQAELQLSVLAARCDAFHGRLVVVEQWADETDEIFDDLRQQIADLRASNSALIEAILKTDGDDEDADF